jgi:hypothetical protein
MFVNKVYIKFSLFLHTLQKRLGRIREIFWLAASNWQNVKAA